MPVAVGFIRLYYILLHVLNHLDKRRESLAELPGLGRAVIILNLHHRVIHHFLETFELVFPEVAELQGLVDDAVYFIFIIRLIYVAIELVVGPAPDTGRAVKITSGQIVNQISVC